MRRDKIYETNKFIQKETLTNATKDTWLQTCNTKMQKKFTNTQKEKTLLTRTRIQENSNIVVHKTKERFVLSSIYTI